MNSHYFFTDADETEIKYMQDQDAESLYKYGIDNDKPWTVFTSVNPGIEDIQRAMDLVSSM
tara:strand:+ start:2274 stop:2456 length:183 start_codon:yes stop_codon:yes gene_type:complete